VLAYLNYTDCAAGDEGTLIDCQHTHTHTQKKKKDVGGKK